MRTPEAMLVIDLQVSAFRDREIHDAEGLVSRINLLAGRVRRSQGRVIFIQHQGEPGSGYEPGSDGWRIDPRLKVQDTDLAVGKTTCDSFCGTGLETTLRELGASTLIITGWATDFCVDTTVRSAVSRGYRVVIPSDCHSVSDREHLSAQEIITHHNFIWANLITTGEPVVVGDSRSLFQK